MFIPPLTGYRKDKSQANVTVAKTHLWPRPQPVIVLTGRLTVGRCGFPFVENFYQEALGQN